MAIILNGTGSGFNRSVINDNFQKIEDELNNNVLRREVFANEVNSMRTDLDMNSQRILNLPKPENAYEPARLIDLSNIIGNISLTPDAKDVTFEGDVDYSVDNVESALEVEAFLRSGIQDNLTLLEENVSVNDLSISGLESNVNVLQNEMVVVQQRSLNNSASASSLDNSKADRDQDAVESNIAVFDNNGNPVDSGSSLEDLGGVIVSETVPVSGFVNGTEWYNPSEATSYIYFEDEDSGQWVEKTVQSAEGTLRSELAATDSNVLVGGVESKTVASRFSDKQFAASPSNSLSENNSAFQELIDALPEEGGDVDIYGGDYTSTLTASSLTVGNKTVNFILRNGSKLPDDMPGVVVKTGRYSLPESSIQANRDVRVHNYFDVSKSLADTTTRQYVNHVEGFLDEDGSTTESEFRGYSYDIGTDALSLNREIRGIKGRVYADGGGSNVRGMYSFVESVDNSGFTGILTGFLSTVYRNSGNSPSESVGIRAHMDDGTTAAFQAAGAGINPSTDTVSFAYSCRTGTGQPIMPNEACYQAHGGGDGDMFLGYESNTNTDRSEAPFRVKKDAVTKAAAYFSKNYTIDDNSVQVIQPPATSGMIEVFAESTSQAFGKGYYRVSGTPLSQEAYSGTFVSFTNTVLSGSTGTDGHLTVGTDGSGNIYLENRLGATKSVVVVFTAYTSG